MMEAARITEQKAQATSGADPMFGAHGLMKPEQAAKYLQITPSTLSVWRSTNRQRLPFVKIGGNVRYRREDLDRFIADRLRNAVPA